MITTNTIATLHALANPNNLNLNAWHIVALGAGACIVHAYHSVVKAGGLKRLWANFWNGPTSANNQSTPQNPS